MAISSHRLPIAIMLGAFTVSCGSDPTGNNNDPPQVIAELDLDMYRPDGSTATVTGPVLEAGKAYRMFIQGTYSIWDSEWNSGSCAGTSEEAPMFPSAGALNGVVGVDAQFYFAVPKGSALCNETIPGSGGTPDISLDGGNDFDNPEPISPPSAPAADHRYEYEIVGQGHAVMFEREDSPSSDNYGILKITISEK